MIWIMILVFICSVALTGLVRLYALKRNLLDHPNARSSHTKATPRGGGLAIVVVFLISSIVFYYIGGLEFEPFLVFFAGGILVAGIGYWDDHGHIPARWRILVHLLAAGIAVAWFGGEMAIQFGAYRIQLHWFGYLLGGLFIVWLLNLYNFMDGIDGIAGAETVCVAGGASVISIFANDTLAYSQQSMLVLQLILASGALGFLYWNWPPARIFLGDVGSGFIGYLLGVFVIAATESGSLPVWSWLILLGVFLVDATVTLLRRFIRGERWYEAHRSHAYQHATTRWGSHTMVTLAVIGINILWLLPLSWVAAIRPEMGWLTTLIALAPLLMLTLWLRAGKEQMPGLI